jgi:hypothetical protein
MSHAPFQQPFPPIPGPDLQTSSFDLRFRMKLTSLLTAAGLALLAGCNSLDSPFSDWKLLQTGRDGRVYNPQTGEYEWPKNATPRPKTTPAHQSGRAPATPAPANDGRGYDPIKGEFRDPQPGVGN